jgi:ATP-binding cassette subfamily F protein 3
MLLRLEGVARSQGARNLFRDVSLAVYAGDRIGIVGPNGAGKTTLLRIAAGDDAPDGGRVARGRDVRVGMLRQEIDPRLGRSVREEVSSVLGHLDALEREIATLEAEMARHGQGGGDVPEDLAQRYDRARAAFESGGGFARAARVERVLGGLGFAEAARARPLSSFSGGWLMRVELAKLLLSAPDVLLLDEPTNHLDLPSIQWFEETLEAYRGAALIVSHDRTFLRRHATRVAELENARFTVFEGGYDRFVRQKEERRLQLEAEARSQERRIAETERFIERFRYKASKARQVQSRVKSLAKLERVEAPVESRRAMRLRIPEPVRAGDVVLRLEGVHKRFGENAVYQGVDFLLRRGERVALAGPNGAGKSTLLRIAAGALGFDAGARSLGHNVTVGFYAQHQLETLAPGRSVLEELESVAKIDDLPRLRGHLGAFLFSGDDVQKKVSVLSGGEKARLALAKMLLRPVNFLVLDEPTNHLDVAACEVLEEALADYAGTLLFISHDRAFIDALATRVVEVRAGVLRDHAGNWADFEREQSAAAPAAAPPTASTPAAPKVAPAAPATPAPAPPAAAASKQERIAAREREKERAKRLERTRKRLAAVEGEIAQQEGALEQLHWRLGDPAVHRDADAVRALEAERGGTRSRIDALYREWERLAAEVEAAQEPATPPR